MSVQTVKEKSDQGLLFAPLFVSFRLITIKLLKIRTPAKIAVVTLKLNKEALP